MAMQLVPDCFQIGKSQMLDCVLLRKAGSQQNLAMLDTFRPLRFNHQGVELFARQAGAGPALLLLHGHPQTQAMWHAVAPALALRFNVVLMDLRGYGDSDRPPADANHAQHSKRTMAHDALALMQALGHAQFSVLAHDRGARVAHRLALDHPQQVQRLMLLDIAPTLAMYEDTSDAFARAYWHWFFLIQPAPLPERLINADPVAYVREVMGRRHAGLAAFAPQAMAEYERCIALPGTASSICEDYRASASIDLAHDRADRDAGQRLRMPLRVLWGEEGAVGRCFDVPALWRRAADNFTGRAMPCGHYIAEEAPQLLLREVEEFFAPSP
jgi:haloacetate dehalogenase